MKTKMITMLLTAMLLAVFCCAGTANANPAWLSYKATKVEIFKNPKQNNRKAADYYKVKVTYVVKNNSRNKMIKAFYNQGFAFNAVLENIRSAGIPVKGQFKNTKPAVLGEPLWPGQTVTRTCTFNLDMHNPDLQRQVNGYSVDSLRKYFRHFKFGWACGVQSETVE